MTTRAPTATITCSVAAVVCAALGVGVLLRCTNPVEPEPIPPEVRLMRDTVVSVLDSVRLDALVQGEGTLTFVWTFDSDSSTQDTTTEPLQHAFWDTSDFGRHTVHLQVLSSNGTRSVGHSLVIDVRLYRPVLQPIPDTAVAVNDPLVLTAEASDTNGSIEGYRWVVDSGAVDTMTSGSSLELTWPPNAFGPHTVTVQAFDDDSIFSAPESASVLVLLYAPELAAMQDTVVALDDTVFLHASATDANGTIEGYVWQIDSTRIDTVADTILARSWPRTDTGSHRVIVYAFDDDSVTSDADTFAVDVHLYRPTVALAPDTSTPVYDSLCLQATSADTNGRVVGYVWTLDSLAPDTTGDSVTCLTFSRLDTGNHELIVTSFDDDSVTSLPDTIAITVALLPPAVSLTADTTVIPVHDTLHLVADAGDSNGMVVSYLWTLDSAGAPDTTSVDSLPLRFGLADTGRHVVRVVAIDDDTLASEPDTAVVIVALLPPELEPTVDTSISTTDTLQLQLSATDTNGTVISYYLDTGAAGWDDSAASGAFSLWYDGLSTFPVVVGVRDDDTAFALDTFLLMFNHPPDSVRFDVTTDSVMLWNPVRDEPWLTARLALRATDRNGPQDSLTYRLEMLSDTLTPVVVHDSTADTATIDSLLTGPHAFRLVATDLFGDSAVHTDTLVFLRERRLAFVGHSIVAGVGSDFVSGGFRRGVIDSMQALLGPMERLRVLGAQSSGWLQPPEEDLFVGRSGATSREVHDSLTLAPWVVADINVMMTGVNGNYNYWEQTYTRRIVDTLHWRSMESETFALNGLPIPDTLTAEQPTDSARDAFNEWLDLIVEVRQNAGWGVHVVDAFTVMSVDSAFNDTLFHDYLHPNQTGYDRLAEAIAARIRNKW